MSIDIGRFKGAGNDHKRHKGMLFPGKDAICWQCITRWCENNPQIALSTHEEGRKPLLFVC
jgi:hypothetical protein